MRWSNQHRHNLSVDYFESQVDPLIDLPLDNGVRIKREDTKGREAIAQYIIRNVFNIKKVKFVQKTSKVIYQGRMKKGKNFEVYSALEFIAAIFTNIEKGVSFVW